MKIKEIKWTKEEQDKCVWCHIKGYERFECIPIDDDGHSLVYDHMVQGCIADYCPKCGRWLHTEGEELP